MGTRLTWRTGGVGGPRAAVTPSMAQCRDMLGLPTACAEPSAEPSADVPAGSDCTPGEIGDVQVGPGTGHETIQSGADAAAALGGGVVTVAAGIYPERLALERGHDGVRMVGACPEFTILDADGSSEPAIRVDAGTNSIVGLERFTIRGGGYGGVLLTDGTLEIRSSLIDASDVVILENTFAGVVVDGASLQLSRADIQDNATDPSLGGGSGIVADSSDNRSHLIVEDTWIGAHAIAAVVLSGPADIDLRRNTLLGGVGVALREDLVVMGNAVLAADGIGADDLLLSGNLLASGAGPALFLHGASATLDGETNLWSGDGDAIWQQHCDGVAPPDDYRVAPSAVICPEEERPVLPIGLDIMLEDLEVEY